MRENLNKILFIYIVFSQLSYAQNLNDSDAPIIVDSLQLINHELQSAGTSTDSQCSQDSVPTSTVGEYALQKAVNTYTPEQFKKEAIAASKDPNTVEINATNFSRAFKAARAKGLLFFKFKGSVYGSLNLVEKLKIENRVVIQAPNNSSAVKNIATPSYKSSLLSEVQDLVNKDTIKYIENVKHKMGDFGARASDLLRKIEYTPYDVNSGEISTNKSVRSLYETPYGRWLKERIEYNIRAGVNIIPTPPSITLIISRDTWARMPLSKKVSYFDRACGVGIDKIMRKLKDTKAYPEKPYLKTELLNSVEKYYGPETKSLVIKKLDLGA